MDKYFYDKKNFDNINQVIDGAVFKKTGQHVDPKHSKLVYKLMDYVYKTTGRPEGLKKKQFLTLLNHQVIKVALPRIEQLTMVDGNGSVSGGSVSGGSVGGGSDGGGMSGGPPLPSMNSERRQDFNFDERLSQAQMDRGMRAPPQASMQNSELGGAVMPQAQQQQAVGTVSDNAMSQDDAEAMYEKLLANRQQGIQNATTSHAGQNLEQRNSSMTSFENKQREINSGVEHYSERIEERGEGEKAVGDSFDEQFKPILGGSDGVGGHPASSQASDFNSLIGQNVETLLAKRLDEQVVVKNNGGFIGGADSTVGGTNIGDNFANMFDKVSVSGSEAPVGSEAHVGSSRVEPVIEKMVGNMSSSVIEDVGDNSQKQQLVQEDAFRNRMVVPPVPQEKYIKRQYYVNIDSRDRDLEVYPDVNKFQVKFAPSSDSNEVFQYRDASGEILYQTHKNFLGDGHGASLPEIFNNIFSIECVSAIVPYDITYVCGICPYQYNGSTTDENKVASANQFTSWPYGPVYNAPTGQLAGQNLGVATSVLDEPYLLLNVDELEGNNPYIGTNKATTNTFAKLLHDGYFGVLTSFIQMKTDHGERKTFKPQAFGKLDKMTLNLNKHNGIRYNFGTDKIFVRRFEPAGEGEDCMTNVIIVPPDDDCGECGVSHGHCLKPGNLIYMYDTVDCVNNEIRFFEHVQPTVANAEDVGASVADGGSELVITATVAKGGGTSVNFAAFINIGDYIMIESATNGKYALRVNRFSGNGFQMYVDKPDDFDTPAVAITKFGFYKKNMKGITSEAKGKFNYIDGKRVCGTEDGDYEDEEGNTWPANSVFKINFPYANLPERLKSKYLTFGDTNDTQSEVFFIKKKMQVSYTFRITVLEQDINKVHSSMV